MKSKAVLVNVIERKGESALVEWIVSGIPRRAFIPAVEIIEDQAPIDILEAGVPYGVDWENITLEASAAALAINLRRNNIWTSADLQANVQVVLGCIQATYGVDLAKLAQYAASKKTTT
jgi:tryptophan synthase alpha subunit